MRQKPHDLRKLVSPAPLPYRTVLPRHRLSLGDAVLLRAQEVATPLGDDGRYIALREKKQPLANALINFLLIFCNFLQIYAIIEFYKINYDFFSNRKDKNQNRPSENGKPAYIEENVPKMTVKNDLLQKMFQKRKDYEETLSQVYKPTSGSDSRDLDKTISRLAIELKTQKSVKMEKNRILRENKIVLRKDPDADLMVVKFENTKLKRLRRDLALIVNRVKSFDEGDCTSIIGDRLLSDQLSELNLESFCYV